MLVKSILIFTCFSFFISLESSWLERKAEGWAWYEQRDLIEDKKVGDPIERNERTESARDKIKKSREDLEEKLSQAILNPSVENVKIYMIEQKKRVDQSTEFSTAWKRVLLEYPELDSTIDHPVSQYGVQVSKHIEEEKRNALIRGLSKKHGIFFFFKSECKFCLAFSKVVKSLENKFSWTVIPVSMDGGSTPEYSVSQVDNGISEKLGVDRVPSLFVVNPESEKVTPVSFGALPLSQVESNIYLQFSGEDEL